MSSIFIVIIKMVSMPKYSSIFKTPEDEAKYMAAYEAVLALWPVPYESFDVPTRFGKTHIIASGPKEAQPLVLLHARSLMLAIIAGSTFSI